MQHQDQPHFRVRQSVFKRKPRTLRLLFFGLCWNLASTNAFASTLPLDHSLLRCEQSLQARSQKNPTNHQATSALPAQDLLLHISKVAMIVPEFQFIREAAQQTGLRVWLFGGTAASFLHYAKWDLERQRGLMHLQDDRFDYDFTNIFRSTQDLDIVVDASPERAREFQNLLANRFPHFLGSKANKWEVRTLRHRIGMPGDPGFKEALLDDTDFHNQNTDSNSIGMVELTQRGQEPMVRDLKHWQEPESRFLRDVLQNKISFLRSPKHFTTIRALAGENPEILSVVRFLVKAFQYELRISESDRATLHEIIKSFDPGTLKNSAARRRLGETAQKLIFHAVNLEYAINTRDELGLRRKLISLGDPLATQSFAWWLNREPLRSQPVGLGDGPTAAELKLNILAHETNNFLAYESITRSHSGEPNVLTSRDKALGEAAIYGDGFYTRIGKEGARGSGFTIRFRIDPGARQGSDFTLAADDFVIVHNKRALSVIPESLNLSLDDLLQMAEHQENFAIDHSDLGLLEKLKRKMNATKINDEFSALLNSHSPKNLDRLIEIINAFHSGTISRLISAEVLDHVAMTLYERVQSWAKSNNEADQINYLRVVGPIAKLLDKQKTLLISDFQKHLKAIYQTNTNAFNLQFTAATENLFSGITLPHSLGLLTPQSLEHNLDIMKDLAKSHRTRIQGEFSRWPKSTDWRKRTLSGEIIKLIDQALEEDRVTFFENLTEAGLLELTYTNVSGYSLLMLAAYYRSEGLIRWLARNPKYPIGRTDKLGFNEVEQLHRFGFDRAANIVTAIQPEWFERMMEPHDQNRSAHPVKKFVRFEAGQFMMGNIEKKILTAITKPFAVFSTATTVEQWQKTNELFEVFLDNPEKYQSGMYFEKYWSAIDQVPITNISNEDVDRWIAGLNQLSLREETHLQTELAKIFPGHRGGATYRLPTEAEAEYMARLGGLAQGQFSSGPKESHFVETEWYIGNSPGGFRNAANHVHPVGTKKPVYYQGEPLYDIQGNAKELCSDWYDPDHFGGIDPKGAPAPVSKWGRSVHGNCYFSQIFTSTLGFRKNAPSESKSHYRGFRLVQTIEDSAE
jgi:formylglycine-generating enzyme required for sulfatase activity